MTTCLVRLRLTHEWCDGQPVEGLSLQPDKETAALLRRHDLWSRMDGTDWTLYAGRAGSPALLLAGLVRNLGDDPLRLNFTGDLPHLASITGLSTGRRTLPHFSSRCVTTDPVGGPMIRSLTPQSDMGAPPASVWLYPEDLAQAAPKTVWCLRFPALALPWTFYVVNRSRSPLHEPFVRGSDGGVLDGPVATLLPDGETALRFDTGDRPLPFRKAPDMSFGLFDRFRSPLSTQTTEICLKRSLPLPAATSLMRDGAEGGGRIRAAAIVYL
jgi:hypothetical protein